MVRLITVGLVLITSHVYGQKSWVVDSSSISFRIKNAGMIVNGTFTGLEAQIAFNPKNLKNSLIVASVDASSVDTGIRIRNNHLQNSDYFDVDAYPQISMQSENFQKKAEGQFLGMFTIYLKDKEGHMLIPFTSQKEGMYHILNGSFEIDRLDYGIGEESVLLDDKVRIMIWLKLREKKEGIK